MVAVFLTEDFLGDADGDASAELVFFLVDVAELVAIGFLLAEVACVLEVECVLVGVVEVDMLSCFLWAQETKNAIVAMAVMEKRTDFFIGCG